MPGPWRPCRQRRRARAALQRCDATGGPPRAPVASVAKRVISSAVRSSSAPAASASPARPSVTSVSTSPVSGAIGERADRERRLPRSEAGEPALACFEAVASTHELEAPLDPSVDLDGNQQHRRGSYSLGRATHTLGQPLQVADLMLRHVFEREARAFELGTDRGRARSQPRTRSGSGAPRRRRARQRPRHRWPVPPPRPRSAWPRRGCRPAPAPTRPRQAHRGRPRRPRPPAVLDAQPSRPRQSMVEGRSSSQRPAIDSPDGPASQTTRCGTSRGVTCRPRGGRPRLSLPPRPAKRAGSAQAREGPRTAALLLHVRGPGRAGRVPAPDHLAPGPEGLRALDLVTTGPKLSRTGSRWIAPRSGRRTWGRWGAHERS